ncbi:nickel pincer cofactor-dependent isomerase, group 22 [Blastococcus deserti]|uniref:LarA-like N-terminal domain-containing protein n=1 Tax=Blastococcus deserti TaxID=2259033 RepID=A0ABW4X5Y6_9ACTN
MTDDGGRNLGPFEALRGLEFDAPFPNLIPVRQDFDATRLDDVAAATTEALEPLRSRVRPGMSVAITAGSRGIHDKPAVVRAAGAWLRSVGAEPFVVPAMGSHGGATAEGQLQMLADLGMTEEYLGMPIHATMETVELDRLPGGPAVHLDAHAAKADAILAVNRIKAHTDFKGEIESGIAKIIAIGLGKRRGAEGIHAYGPANLGVWIPRVARRIVDTGKVLGGLGIIENAYDRAAQISLLEPEDIAGDGEARLLDEAKKSMATLPFDEIDVAVIDAMGKNVSGSGMDPNVIGRMMIRGTPDLPRPRITNIAVLDVTDISHGNVVGLGLADFIPFRILEKVDLRITYINAMTAGLGGPQRAQVPMAMATDRSAVAAAMLTCGRAELHGISLVRMRNTLDLEHLLVSENLRDQVRDHPRLEVTGDPRPMRFDGDGQLEPW